MEPNLEIMPKKQKNWFHGYIRNNQINIITIPDIHALMQNIDNT